MSLTPATPAAAAAAPCVSASVASVVSSACLQLSSLYSSIGIGAEDQAALLGDLEARLGALCAATIQQAQDHVRKIQDEMHAAASKMAKAAKQLQNNTVEAELQATIAAANPPLSLQQQLALHDAAYASVVEQKQLHMTVLSGDLSRVQALYTQMSIPASDVPDASMLEIVTADTADLSKARTLRVQAELVRLQGVLAQRFDTITNLTCELSGQWSRLGYGPANMQHPEIDALLMEDAQSSSSHGKKSPLAPTPQVIAALQVRKAELDAAAVSRAGEIDIKTAQIAALHKRLGSPAEQVDKLAAQCAALAASTSPLSASVLSFYDEQIASLEKLKQARMQGLVFDLRMKIDAVYNDLQMSAAERGAFVPFQSMLYNDAVLEMHEAELARVIERRTALAPIFAMVSKWKLMKDEVAAFEISSQDPTRLTKRGSHLILAQEEKLRKKRDVALPALERKMLDLVEAYEAQANGDIVTLQGSSLRAGLESSIAARDEGKTARRKVDEESRKAKKDASTAAREEAAAGGKAAPTPAKVARSATAAESKVAATPARTARAATMEAPASSAKVDPIAATPLKASSKIGAASFSTPAPAAAPSASIAATPVTPAVRSRIPTFGTTVASLQTVLATPSTIAEKKQTASRTASTTASASVSAAASAENSENEEEDEEEENDENQTAAAPATMTIIKSERAVFGEIKSSALNTRAIVPVIEDIAAKPVTAPTAAASVSVDSLDLDMSATLLSDVSARVAVCDSDADRLEIYTQALHSISPAPTVAQLSKLHYSRAQIYWKLGQQAEAETDEDLSEQFSKQYQEHSRNSSANNLSAVNASIVA